MERQKVKREHLLPNWRCGIPFLLSASFWSSSDGCVRWPAIRAFTNVRTLLGCCTLRRRVSPARRPSRRLRRCLLSDIRTGTISHLRAVSAPGARCRLNITRIAGSHVAKASRLLGHGSPDLERVIPHCIAVLPGSIAPSKIGVGPAVMLDDIVAIPPRLSQRHVWPVAPSSSTIPTLRSVRTATLAL